MASNTQSRHLNGGEWEELEDLWTSDLKGMKLTLAVIKIVFARAKPAIGDVKTIEGQLADFNRASSEALAFSGIVPSAKAGESQAAEKSSRLN